MTIKQKPFNATLMSSIKAAYEYYYNETISDSLLFGLSGHAFMIHFTNGLGACAPYTWDMKDFSKLVNENLGLDMFTSQEFLNKETETDLLENATLVMKKILDSKKLVFISSLEYQLITDYTSTHFLTTKPWDAPSVTPDLEFNTFKEMLDFLSFFKVEKTKRIPIKEGVRNSIDYAISLFENKNQMLDSGMGIEAYDFFLSKINEDNANGHGLWWSSNVWSESRKMASKYMNDLTPYFDNKILKELSKKFIDSSNILLSLASKESSKDIKMKLIKELEVNELEICKLLKKL